MCLGQGEPPGSQGDPRHARHGEHTGQQETTACSQPERGSKHQRDPRERCLVLICLTGRICSLYRHGKRSPTPFEKDSPSFPHTYVC